MKVSLNWLREWIDPGVPVAELAERLTLAGLELEHAPLLAERPSGVVVGRIEAIEAHPKADRLRVCRVDTGGDALHQIVCGAANARQGLVAPVALPGAKLPNGMQIGAAELRGVPSAGMLCSEAELGLAEKSAGLMELADDAPIGEDINAYLGLDDTVLELELTPNRGDCLSVLGLARECAALYERPLSAPPMEPVAPQTETVLPVRLDNAQACSSYAGRVIEGIRPDARTPDWMIERLRRGGIRAIHPVVDITNYVMLELGQPMHAFDVAQLHGGITVRDARPGERIELLNEQTVTLNHGELLIADEARALALAGVMGGQGSGVTGSTVSIFLESARFTPEAVAGTGRRHKLHSDSLHRFERGVDPGLQRRALERATALVLSICGGRPGPVVHEGCIEPAPVQVELRHARLQRLLGVPVAAETVAPLLARLRIQARPQGPDRWSCTIPSARTDLRLEVDLIEELARLIGYHNIHAAPYAAQLSPAPVPEARLDGHRLRDALVARGFHEIVSYSFVDPADLAALQAEAGAIALDNPIAETMAVMRTTLLPGLLNAWRHNAQRQQRRAALFEIGKCFVQRDGQIVETERLGVLMAGELEPEQWGLSPRAADFFDLKGELEALFGARLQCEADEQPALHPGQSARLLRDGEPVGWIGSVHPAVCRSFDVPGRPVAFELDLDAVRDGRVPVFEAVGDRPASRRDLALVLRESVTAAALLKALWDNADDALREVRIFDVYRGKGLPGGCKSVALGLIFQDKNRTLTDQEVDSAVQRIVEGLSKRLGASIRD